MRKMGFEIIFFKEDFYLSSGRMFSVVFCFLLLLITTISIIMRTIDIIATETIEAIKMVFVVLLLLLERKMIRGSVAVDGCEVLVAFDGVLVTLGRFGIDDCAILVDDCA